MLTSELKGLDLDLWVARAMGKTGVISNENNETKVWICQLNDIEEPVYGFSPSTDWFDVGPIIEEKRISLRQVDDRDFKGKIIIACIEPQYPLEEGVPLATGAGWWSGDTALEAICRCVVASVYGNEVPDVH